MSSNREKKLNQSDVRIGIWKFVLSFLVLAGVSFMSVFFFFKSYDQQREGISKEVASYQQLLEKSDVLRNHMDDIYLKMEQLDANKVDNDIFLRNNILSNIQLAREVMGKDSASNFKHYAILINQIGSMIDLKTKIIEVEHEKEMARRDIEECMGKVDIANDKLRIDPTRKFTGSRRRR